jgi:hypothetical protein
MFRNIYPTKGFFLCMKHSAATIRLEIEKLREDTERTQMILDMAISSGHQAWAIPFLQEQLKASKELLAFVMQNEPSEAA